MNIHQNDLKAEFSKLLLLAGAEDLGAEGDLSSQAIFTDSDVHEFGLYSRAEGVLSGLQTAELCFTSLIPAPELKFIPLLEDGDPLHDGQLVARIYGPVASILGSERIALNFLGFLSGIASTTGRHVQAASPGTVEILDTRKTLPGYRLLSKAAVVDGGGVNHRIGLYDMIMLKDNHIDSAGSIEVAVKKARERWGSTYSIEVECRNEQEVLQALKCDVDVIMLDNMSREECSRAIELRKQAGRDPKTPKNGQKSPGRQPSLPSVKFEASGDFTPDKIAAYADLNLDYISVGGLTHSVENHNFSLRSYTTQPVNREDVN